MIFPKEVWRDVVGYERFYQVSSVGRVRSLNYNHTGQSKVLKQRKDKDGYLIVGLNKDGKQKTHKAHRLVAQAFIPNPDNKPQVDHINTIKTDNYYKNLRWTTREENYYNPLSREHYLEAMRSEDHRKKLREINNGKDNPFYGMKHTEESKRKMSETRGSRVEVFREGMCLGVFRSTRELEKSSEELFGIKLNHGGISRVCLGKSPHYKGFTFQYAED